MIQTPVLKLTPLIGEGCVERLNEIAFLKHMTGLKEIRQVLTTKFNHYFILLLFHLLSAAFHSISCRVQCFCTYFNLNVIKQELVSYVNKQ